MRPPRVPYLRIISRSSRSNKKLGKRAPHGVVGAASPSIPATATKSTSVTMSGNANNQNNPPRAPENGHNPANFLPPAHALPPRPSFPQWAEEAIHVANNGLTEEDRRTEAYRQENAQLRQPRPATGQLPNQSGFFNGNLPPSKAPSGAPPFAGSFALTQPGPLNGKHSLSHWFTGQGPFNNNNPPFPPPPPPFGGALPHFFTGGFPVPPPFPPPFPPPMTPSPASATAQYESKQPPWRRSTNNIRRPFGQIPHPPAGLPRFVQPSSNMEQSQVNASETPNEYACLHTARSCKVQKRRTDNTRSAGVPNGQNEKKKDPKIYLPAPIPTHQYLTQASLQAEVRIPPSRKLVILDLNGTLIYRPNSRKQPRKMIARPFLEQFLAYLFDHFAVMVWSSAKPDNVSVLVEIGLGDYRHRLIGCWARDTLGLAPKHYSLNVQCYKNLQRIWASTDIQRHAPGARFDQRNTILIDDSSLKAAAQPHNLLEIPEFKGVDPHTPVQDVLAEVVGYLEVLKMQEDVSKFIHKDPFRANGDWRIEWNELALESLQMQNHFALVSSAR
ncbi:HAD-like protein [Karstenula rhodostoma CBS 690.94]|uniref:Mitochondrial import inner membrane translocase subunit TIM50 n=1 Tax=Karstenula rhodostoma CBS 690.94 TaxID=1392251 RepID=A0A9P4PID3_9PLEO|nr:HAD-like protein [Karstenula rhodostoma CBS 690.94]